MSITLAKITLREHHCALRWLRDVRSPYLGESGIITASQAWRLIESLYEGGWVQFIADQPELTPCSWCGTPTDQWLLGTPDCGC